MTYQNVYCRGQSAWEVMRKHDDFKGGNLDPVAVSYSSFVADSIYEYIFEAKF